MGLWKDHFQPSAFWVLVSARGVSKDKDVGEVRRIAAGKSPSAAKAGLILWHFLARLGKACSPSTELRSGPWFPPPFERREGWGSPANLEARRDTGSRNRALTASIAVFRSQRQGTLLSNRLRLPPFQSSKTIAAWLWLPAWPQVYVPRRDERRLRSES